MCIPGKLRSAAATILLAQLPLAVAQSQPDSGFLALAQKQIVSFLSQLADVHCTEKVTQEKLADDGHVEALERDQFDYLVMMSGNEDDFQLTESRIETPGLRHKQVSMPLLVTNGMATVLLVFHPYYSDGFVFQTQPEQLMDGKPAIPIHFTHIPGRRTPAALALRGREYPLDLQGTAWLDKSSGQVVKVEASLLHDMSDVGLRSLNIQVEYKPTRLGTEGPQIMMPVSAVVDVRTPRQHWRNTHYFGNYESFSAEAEQAPGVKVHSDGAGSGSHPDGSASSQTKEQP
jgi:hypothetical protein